MGPVANGKNFKDRNLRQYLDRKGRRRAILILIMGLVLMAGDFILSDHSNIPLYKDHKGLYMERGKESEGELSLRAYVKTNSDEYSRNYNVILKAYDKERKDEMLEEDKSKAKESEEEIVNAEMRSLLAGINEDRSKKKIYLPNRLSTGDEIDWKVERQSKGALILFFSVAVAMAVYLSRFKPLDKKRKAEQESVLRQLPEFVNRLVLLLNAGLILNSAFIKSIEDGMKYGVNEKDYFYGRLGEIHQSVTGTNAMADRELVKFAKEIGVNELLRVSNIISDNISKGVSLTEKLQRENEVLWESRKRRCEEKGRLSETKLTMPLTLFLMVLIIISVSPALMKL